MYSSGNDVYPQHSCFSDVRSWEDVIGEQTREILFWVVDSTHDVLPRWSTTTRPSPNYQNS